MSVRTSAAPWLLARPRFAAVVAALLAATGCVHTSNAPAAPRLMVSAGYLHRCVLDALGTVRCEGDDALGQLQAPATPLVWVSAGLYHSCGLTAEGTAVCWGSERPVKGNATPPMPKPPAVKLKALSSGDQYSCGLDAAGELVCWGSAEWLDSTDAVSARPRGSFVAVSAGYDHACALRENGEVQCFGAPPRELQRCEEMESVPAGLCRHDEQIPRGWSAPPPGLKATAIAAGAAHTCAVTAASTAVCWGADGWGDGNTIWAGQTRVPASLSDVVEVSAGGGHSCARHRDGAVTCWGDAPSPTGRFTQLSSGSNFACGVREPGEVVCSASVAKAGGAVSFPDDPRWRSTGP